MVTNFKVPLAYGIDENGNIKPEYCDSHISDERYGLSMGITNTDEFLQIHVCSSQFLQENKSHKRLYIWSIEDSSGARMAEVNEFIDVMNNTYYDCSGGILLTGANKKPDTGIFYGNVRSSSLIDVNKVYDIYGQVSDTDSNQMVFNATNVQYFKTITQADFQFDNMVRNDNFPYSKNLDSKATLRNGSGELVNKIVAKKYSGWKVIQNQFAKVINMGDIDATGAHLWVYEIADSPNTHESLTLRIQWYKPGTFAVAFVVHHNYLYSNKSININHTYGHNSGTDIEIATNYDQAYPAYFHLFTGTTKMTFDMNGKLKNSIDFKIRSNHQNLVMDNTKKVKPLGLRLFSGIQSKYLKSIRNNEDLREHKFVNDIEEYDASGYLYSYFIDASGLITDHDDINYDLNRGNSQSAYALVKQFLTPEQWWRGLSYKIISNGKGEQINSDGLCFDENLIGYVSGETNIDGDPSMNSRYFPKANQTGIIHTAKNKKTTLAHYLSTENWNGSENIDSRNDYHKHHLQLNFRINENKTTRNGTFSSDSFFKLSINGMLVFQDLSSDMADIWNDSIIRLMFLNANGTEISGMNMYSQIHMDGSGHIRHDISSKYGESIIEMKLTSPKSWKYINTKDTSTLSNLGYEIKNCTAFLLQPLKHESIRDETNFPGIRATDQNIYVVPPESNFHSLFDITHISWSLDFTTVISRRLNIDYRGIRTIESTKNIISKNGRFPVKVNCYTDLDNDRICNSFNYNTESDTTVTTALTDFFLDYLYSFRLDSIFILGDMSILENTIPSFMKLFEIILIFLYTLFR